MLSHTTNFSGPRSLGEGMRLTPPPAAHDLNDTLDIMGAAISFARNAEIYGENEPAEYLYKLISGTVRTSKILNGGRRQIGEFYIPGDIFGLEMGNEHAFAAEAITDVKVIVIKRSAVEALASNDHSVARQLRAITGRELQRLQDHFLLVVKSAQERVAGFLLELAERAPSGNEIELPMSRQDIADYLGLTIETVSRTLTILENNAVIALPSFRRIVFRNRAALRRLTA